MSLDLVRVDNRLIHGQIIEAWVPYVKAERIVVVDDATAADPLQRSILELATPGDIRLDVVTIAEAVRLQQAQAFEQSHCIVLFAGPCQAYNAFMAGFRFTALNIGNVHFAQGKTRVSPSVCCDAEELSVLRALVKAGVEVEVRAVPREARKQIPDDGAAASR